jgi:hypothetical protein
MTQRRVYRLACGTIDEMNFILSQIADRLDQMEGYRGQPEFKSDVNLGGNLAVNSGTASAAEDLTPLGQVSSEAASWLTYNKPVGTIHITTSSANPATYLGYGTWAAYGTGRVLVGIDPSNPDYDTAGETGAWQEGAGGNISYIAVYIWRRTA